MALFACPYQLCLLTRIISHHVRLTDFFFCQLNMLMMTCNIVHCNVLLDIQECGLYQVKCQFFLASQLCCRCHFRRMLLGVSQHQGVGGPEVAADASFLFIIRIQNSFFTKASMLRSLSKLCSVLLLLCFSRDIKLILVKFFTIPTFQIDPN